MINATKKWIFLKVSGATLVSLMIWFILNFIAIIFIIPVILCEIDTNDDLDDDTGQNNGNFFSGTNCVDNDDDGNDADADDDGFYQAVWDRGQMTLGLLEPKVYDVDNDNDGVPDGEDPDDDNNGIPDGEQEKLAGCFWGEEQSTWDHDNDGIVNWADDDWDGDGISNTVELAISLTQAFDHDNDGDRDDIDVDDDEDDDQHLVRSRR